MNRGCTKLTLVLQRDMTENVLPWRQEGRYADNYQCWLHRATSIRSPT